MNSTRYSCQNCGRELKSNQRPCPLCGCNSIKVEKALSGSIVIKGALRARQKRRGFKKFVKEIIQGWFPSRNPELSEGVDKQRIVDRQEKEYHEVIRDVKTGKTIREIHEPLGQHKRQ